MHRVMAAFRKTGKKSSWSSTGAGSTGRSGSTRRLTTTTTASLPFLTGPLWAPRLVHRRLLARDEGYDWRDSLFPICLSLPAHTPGPHRASRATDL